MTTYESSEKLFIDVHVFTATQAYELKGLKDFYKTKTIEKELNYKRNAQLELMILIKTS